MSCTHLSHCLQYSCQGGMEHANKLAPWAGSLGDLALLWSQDGLEEGAHGSTG